MVNPFEEIIERLRRIEEQIALSASASPDVAADIIDREELCKRLGITEPTAIRWGKRGKIPVLRIGSAVRYNWVNVLKALEKHS